MPITEGEKNTYINIFDKASMIGLSRELLNLSNNTKQPNLRMGKGLVYTFFPKENTQMVNRHMKTWPVILVSREMQVKATMRPLYWDEDHHKNKSGERKNKG